MTYRCEAVIMSIGYVEMVKGIMCLQSWFSDGAWRKEDLLQVVAKCRYQDCDQLKGTGHYRNIIKR